MEGIKKKNYDKIISELHASLAWMDLVFSDINDGILVINDKLKVTFANDAIAKMTGKSRIEMLGIDAWNVLQLNTNGKLLQEQDYQEALEQKNFEMLSGRYYFHANDDLLRIDIEASFITSLNQAVIIIRDITEQLKNEKALMDERISHIEEQAERRKAEDNRQLLQNIMDGTTAIIYLKDLKGRYLTVNNQFEKVFGVNRDAIQGKTDIEAFSEEISKILHEGDGEIIERKDAIRKEVSIHLNNELRYFIFLKYPLVGYRDEPNIICGVLTDITARKRLEESKNNFIKVIHHELNTPLTVMKIFLKTVQNHIGEGKNQAAANDLSKIEDQLEQVTKLTDDLLDVVRMEKTELTYSKEEFNLTELIKKAIDNEQAKTEKHSIRLHGNPPDYNVLADKQRIGQVMRNLLSNAVKYSPEGGEVNIRVSGNSDYITVSVQDFGIGVPKEQQKQIFEQFNRGNIRENDFSGLGIGLYITSEIIKNHGGSINVESEEGQGSTFSIRLPVKDEVLTQ